MNLTSYEVTVMYSLGPHLIYGFDDSNTNVGEGVRYPNIVNMSCRLRSEEYRAHKKRPIYIFGQFSSIKYT